MCIIALAQKGKFLSADRIAYLDKINGHGIGMAYVNPKTKKVVIDKGYQSAAVFAKAYQEHLDNGIDKNAHMVHFRITTTGGRDVINCHPFEIKGGAMAHNGTFFGRGEHMGGKSDSRIVAERMYNNFAYPLMKRNFKEYEKALGYSRVAFLYDNGEYFITNENSKAYGPGWEDGIWYSNGGYAGFRGGNTSGNYAGNEANMGTGVGDYGGRTRPAGAYYGNGGQRSFGMGGRDQ